MAQLQAGREVPVAIGLPKAGLYVPRPLAEARLAAALKGAGSHGELLRAVVCGPGGMVGPLIVPARSR
jgi:hypothetical protein